MVIASNIMAEEVNFESNATVYTTFDSLCRICSKKYEQGRLIHLFKNDNDLLEKVTSCLPVTVHRGDNLPHQVCNNCLKVVESTFELIIRAKSSEKYFFNILKAVESGSSLIVEETSSLCDGNFENNVTKQPISLDLEGSFVCDVCGVQLYEVEALDQHIQEKHVHQSIPPNTEFTVHKICSLCGQLFESDEIYMLHKCESQHQCSNCNKVLPTKCLLNRHIQHSCKPQYYCPHCHKTFSVKNLFLQHVQVHTGQDGRNDCLACKKKHKGSRAALMHTCDQTITERNGKKFKCYICGQGYKRQLNLARHCLQHEPKSKWKFKCQMCDGVFEKEKILHSHYEKIHKMPKTWICRFCGKSLSTKLSLEIHERIHTKVKPYVCEWCGNAFRSKANLIQHHAKHTGIRRHKCPVCGKMFSRTFFLKTHLRVHTGERPYQCDICEQRFTQVGDMRRHRRRHDNTVRPAVFIVRNTSAPDVSIETFEPIETIDYVETVETKIEIV